MKCWESWRQHSPHEAPRVRLNLLGSTPPKAGDKSSVLSRI